LSIEPNPKEIKRTDNKAKTIIMISDIALAIPPISSSYTSS